MQDAKTQLSQLVARAEKGESIVIARHGVGAVRLEPVLPRLSRELGFLSIDLPASFFDALPDDELEAWEG